MKSITALTALAIAISSTAYAAPQMTEDMYWTWSEGQAESKNTLRKEINKANLNMMKFKKWNDDKKKLIANAIAVEDINEYAGDIPEPEVSVSYSGVKFLQNGHKMSFHLTDEALLDESITEVATMEINLNGKVLESETDIIKPYIWVDDWGYTFNDNKGIGISVDLGDTITLMELKDVATDLATIAAKEAYKDGYDDGYKDGYRDGWNARGLAISNELNCTWCN